MCLAGPVFTSTRSCTSGEDSREAEVPPAGDEDAQDAGGLDGYAALFFISFIVFVAWTLLQVVVAVLLDNFTAAADQEKARKAQVS